MHPEDLDLNIRIVPHKEQLAGKITKDPIKNPPSEATHHGAQEEKACWKREERFKQNSMIQKVKVTFSLKRRGKVGKSELN